MNHKRGLARISGIVAIAFFLAVLGSSAAAQYQMSKPQVSVSPEKVKGAGTLAISGSGFKANQKVAVMTMMGGVLSDISFLVKPKLKKADDQGAFTAKWKLKKRYGKLLKTGSNPIIIVDKDGKELASSKFNYEKKKKKKK